MHAESLARIHDILPTSLEVCNHWHVFRVLPYQGYWLVVTHGRYTEFDTEQAALTWLAGYCLKLSCVPEQEPQ